ncbi:unnamed protein product, partial [Ectocarpus sp. 12 AP-2014]
MFFVLPKEAGVEARRVVFSCGILSVVCSLAFLLRGCCVVVGDVVVMLMSLVLLLVKMLLMLTTTRSCGLHVVSWLLMVILLSFSPRHLGCFRCFSPGICSKRCDEVFELSLQPSSSLDSFTQCSRSEGMYVGSMAPSLLHHISEG